CGGQGGEDQSEEIAAFEDGGHRQFDRAMDVKEGEWNRHGSIGAGVIPVPVGGEEGGEVIDAGAAEDGEFARAEFQADLDPRNRSVGEPGEGADHQSDYESRDDA